METTPDSPALAPGPTAVSSGSDARAGRRVSVPPRLQRAFRAEELAGLRLATLARTIVLGVVAVGLAFLEAPGPALYYEAVILALVASGGLQYVLRTRLGKPWVSHVFVVVDAALLMYALVFLTAELRPEWPAQMALRTAPAAYFFLLIASVCLIYSPGLTLWAGAISVLAWSTGVLWLATRPDAVLAAADASAAARLTMHVDPHFVDLRVRAEELVTLFLCAAILAVEVRRSQRLVIRQAAMARERANLARYFSPTVVDELAGRDEPFGPVRRQQVGVLFADIAAFTTFAEAKAPEDVMALLRDFHARMEEQVFHHGGTLEKFIGDALLATFGVPNPAPDDASRTLACGRAMLSAVEQWNRERVTRGEAPIRIGVGAHFGPAVLGEIGSRRAASFAVVGDTVNTTSRLQSLAREIGSSAVVSDALVEAIRNEGATSLLDRLAPGGTRSLRGREHAMEVWLLDHAEAH